jgi:hypothetical protein
MPENVPFRSVCRASDNGKAVVKDFLQRHAFLRRAVLLLAVFYCFRAATLEFTATRQYQQAAKWPSAQAVISSGSVRSMSYSWSAKQVRSCPALGYTYTVQGRTYNGYNRTFDYICWPDANDFVAQHPPGASIRITYDPANPAVSIIPDAMQDPGYPWADTIGGIVFALILPADLFGAWTAESKPGAGNLESESNA